MRKRKREPLPGAGVIAEAWSEQLATWGIDTGHSRCWFCRTTAIALERHHIVPHELGGTDDASNLVLLCHRCHAEAPTCTDTDVFAMWMDGQAEYIASGDGKIDTAPYSDIELIYLFAKDENEGRFFAEWVNSLGDDGTEAMLEEVEFGLHFDNERGPRIPRSGMIGYMYKKFRASDWAKRYEEIERRRAERRHAVG